MAKNLYTIAGYRRQWNSSSVRNDVVAYLAGGQAEMNTPDTATTYYAVSSSAQDLTAGTGVDRVRIVYLDANGSQQVMTSNLNGTTGVSIGSGISFIQWIESYHSTTANRSAAGDVSISSANSPAGVTEANTMERIRAGGNRSQSARYKVPANKRARIVDYHATAVKTGGGSTQYDIEFRATLFNDDNSLSNAYHFIRGAYVQDGGILSDDVHYKEAPEGAVLKITIIPTNTADGNIIKCAFDIEVIDNY